MKNIRQKLELHYEEKNKTQFSESYLIDHYNKAHNEFRVSLFKKIHKEQFELDIGLSSEMKIVRQHMQDLKQFRKERNADLRNDAYIWLTINPPPKNVLDIKQFNDDIRKLLEYKCFKDYSYCIEYYTKTGQHPHCHILIDRNLDYKPFYCKQKIINSPFYKKYYKNTKVNNNNLNFQKIGKEFKQDKKEYIFGKKDKYKGDLPSEADKSDLRLKDQKWRLENKIYDIYSREGDTKYRFRTTKTKPIKIKV